MDEDVTGTGSRQTLQGIAEIRHFFRTNETPIYFVGATPFNLLGIDRWVRNFRYVTYYDAWDGEHPHVITPRDKPYIEFSSGEEINNYCCCIEMRARMGGGPARPKVAMVFFDEETERICDELGYDLVLPRRRCASASTRRSSPPSSATRRERPASRTCWCPWIRGNPRPRVDRSRARHRPRRADAVRRLGKDDVLHLFGG